MITFAILDYNRPLESELCLQSIRKNAKFPHKIVYLSNGGVQDYAIKFYKDGLIDKLILRNKNSGCGLGTRELYNDFDLDSKYIIYVQCDQFLYREFSQQEIEFYIQQIESGYAYVDLAGNQGHGNYSERAHLMNKYYYQTIPNDIGGPGPYADSKWTEQCVQEFMKDKKFIIANPHLFADNGKISRREYPCGGCLVQYTDSKAVFIEKPIINRIDFPNLHLTDDEWAKIISGQWINGTIPQLHKESSFNVWERPYSIGDFK
jgi:hypothetical protein